MGRSRERLVWAAVIQNILEQGLRLNLGEVWRTDVSGVLDCDDQPAHQLYWNAAKAGLGYEVILLQGARQ